MANLLEKKHFLSVTFLTLLLLLSGCSLLNNTTSLTDSSSQGPTPTLDPQSPETPGDVYFWLATDDSNSYQVNSSDQILKLYNKMDTSQWMSSSAPSLAPTLVTDTDNKLKWIKFLNGQFVSMEGDYKSLMTDWTVIMAVRNLSMGSLIEFDTGLSSFEDGSSVSVNSNNQVVAQHGTTVSDYGVNKAFLLDSQVQVIAVTFASISDPLQMRIFLNGFRVTLTDTSKLGSPSPFLQVIRNILVGAGNSQSANFQLGEMIFYKKGLDLQQIYTVSKWLGKKWGATVKDQITTEISNNQIIDNAEVNFERIKDEIFATKGCLACHNESRIQDNIDLSSYAGILKSVSSSSGQKVLTPGSLSQSGIYQAVSGSSPSMPQNASTYGGYLNQLQVKLLSDWITAGAKE